MPLQPSASKSYILKNCSYAFDPKLEISGGGGTRASRYGSAFHEIIAAVIVLSLRSGVKPVPYPKLVEAAAKKWGANADELAEHVWGSFRVLRNWMMGKNPWGIDWTLTPPTVEGSYAIKPTVGSGTPADVRPCEGPSEAEHLYPDVRRGELPATVDLAVAAHEAAPALVLDHKTGSSKDFSSPDEDDQMKTLSLISSSPVLAVLHADRRGLPIVYASGEISRDAQRDHAKVLRKALRRVGDGSLNPGPWCKYCPARAVCPSQFADLIPSALAIVEQAGLTVRTPDGGLTKAEEVGKLHMLAKEMGKLIEKAEKEIRLWVQNNPSATVVRPDGKHLEFVERSYESISKQSIVDALGKIEGEKLLNTLRKKGVMKTQTRNELWAVDD